MNRFTSLYILLTVAAVVLCSFIMKRSVADRSRILVFSRTMGFHHNSIAAGMPAIQKLGAQNGYDVDTTTNNALFTDDNLKKYQAVVFLNTTGNVLNATQQAAFERFIEAGGGFAGVHSAADTEYDWPWYGKLLGAWFESHPAEADAVIDVVDKNHPATAAMPDHWKHGDEWYNYKSIFPDIKVLANLNEGSYHGGTNGGNHPIAWYHAFDGGRAFYTGLGHRATDYTDATFLQHLQGGIKYAIGDGKPLDYTKAYAKVTPEQNRFVKTVLASNIPSPMELAVAPNGKIYFCQLWGDLSVFDTKTNKLKLIHNFPITNAGGTGLIGLNIDPNFAKNHFIYLYYAPPLQVNNPLYFHLARFTLTDDDKIDLKSEKTLLKVEVQRVSGSHHGGSIAWDAQGNLYLSTGDATSPFPSDGYAPLDERYNAESNGDSQGTAANTNDFRGKVLRIHPEPDGTYTIPKGNLFPPGTEKTKPEIYTMGLRNPYRIAVNKRSGVLYWGEVGPDAGNDSKRGPRGYDEFNQAKKAGNFGWPYFVGKNYSYAYWDFATAKPKTDELFNPQAPVNNSPFNTGLKVLPPVNSPMLWYPYAASPEFPELGLGGRCAIGGDVYVYNKNSTSPGRFPDYYDGALFIGDWMRNWVMGVQFDANENYARTEPLMATNGDFRRPIDMTFGPDGALYMLEYGSVYGVNNKDSRLVRITYNRGNRAPLAKASIVDSAVINDINKRAHLTSDYKNIPQLKTIAGAAPLRVNFSAKNSGDMDDDDAITYQWLFDGKTPGPKNIDASYTYKMPGTYKAILKVTDKGGLTSKDTLIIKVGNTAPIVKIESPDNKSFYWKGKPFNYSVNISDKEDGKINPAKVKAFYIYNSLPADITVADIGKPTFGQTVYPGKAMVANSDCKACHQVNALGVGPSLTAVAARYSKDTAAVEMLAKKIIAGGGGNWGKEFVMSAHPQLSVGDAKEIVKYIFSLANPNAGKSGIVNIPLKGSLNLKFNPNEPRGEYTLVAAYTDKGGKIIGPLKATDIVTLRNPEIGAAFADDMKGFSRFRESTNGGGDNSYFYFKRLDLTRITQFTIKYDANTDADIEARLDSKAGPVIAKVSYKKSKEGVAVAQLSKPVNGRHDIYFYAVKRDKPTGNIIHVNSIVFN